MLPLVSGYVVSGARPTSTNNLEDNVHYKWVWAMPGPLGHQLALEPLNGEGEVLLSTTSWSICSWKREGKLYLGIKDIAQEH